MHRALRIVVAVGIAGAVAAMSVSGTAVAGTKARTASSPAPIWFCPPGETANPATSGYCHQGTAQGTADCAADAILAGALNLSSKSTNLVFTFTPSVSGTLYFALAFEDVRSSTAPVPSSLHQRSQGGDTECSGGEEPNGGPLPPGTVDENASPFNWPQSSFNFNTTSASATSNTSVAIVSEGQAPISAGQKVAITAPLNSTGRAILAYAHAHHLAVPAVAATLVLSGSNIGAAREAQTLHP
jgi:hypothetical protein